MSGLADYLAKNYLTADSEKKSKKRKRKNKDAGLIIDDDDSLGWKDKADDDDEDAPMIVGGGTLKKSKKKSKGTSAATWTAQGPPPIAKKLLKPRMKHQKMVDTDGVMRMESGAKAGLQSAAEVAAATKRKQDEDKRKAEEVAKELGSAAQETIYRDASGRIINVAMKRAEARKKAEEEERIKREKEKAARGDVQNAAAERRKQQLQDAKTMTIARYADDAELNDELKERGHWNDPASGFLRKKKAGRSITGKPLYQGPFQPNRYNIRPGHRWDGIDRGNGFEKQWFDSRNRKANIEKLEYQWQMDE
ncbi:unnamed protein product [Alternaria alternata]